MLFNSVYSKENGVNPAQHPINRPPYSLQCTHLTNPWSASGMIPTSEGYTQKLILTSEGHLKGVYNK